MNKLDNFYCAKEAGTFFSINDWNKKFKLANKMGLEGEERSNLLDDKKCEKQCTDCACIVGEQRLKTKKLIEKLKK